MRKSSHIIAQHGSTYNWLSRRTRLFVSCFGRTKVPYPQPCAHCNPTHTFCRSFEGLVACCRCVRRHGGKCRNVDFHFYPVGSQELCVYKTTWRIFHHTGSEYSFSEDCFLELIIAAHSSTIKQRYTTLSYRSFMFCKKHYI